MQIHTFAIRPRSRAANVALLVAVIGVGALVVVLGLTLLLALAAVGTVAGLATLAWRRLTGRSRTVPQAPPLDRAHGLDPRLEVRAPDVHRSHDRPTLAPPPDA